MLLDSSTQLILNKGSSFKLVSLKEDSVFELKQGTLRIKSIKNNKAKEFKLILSDIDLFFTQAEFEVFFKPSASIDIDVYQGELELRSPHLHTFVPLKIQEKQGATYRIQPPEFKSRSLGPLKINDFEFIDSNKINKI